MSQNHGRKRRRHLSLDEVVRYIERTLVADALSHVENHLAVCDRCLREVLEVTRFLAATSIDFT